jgi:hypothetical protein
VDRDHINAAIQALTREAGAIPALCRGTVRDVEAHAGSNSMDYDSDGDEATDDNTRLHRWLHVLLRAHRQETYDGTWYRANGTHDGGDRESAKNAHGWLSVHADHAEKRQKDRRNKDGERHSKQRSGNAQDLDGEAARTSQAWRAQDLDGEAARPSQAWRAQDLDEEAARTSQAWQAQDLDE